MTKQEVYLLRDKIDGLLNRMMVTDDIIELNNSTVSVIRDITTIYYERRNDINNR